MKHELKVHSQFWHDLHTNKKTFEVRKNDRDYKVGDTLVLKEYLPMTDKFTGEQMTVSVTYVLKGGDWGIKKGYCVLGIKH